MRKNRNPLNTKTVLTIGIIGDCGVGKTSLIYAFKGLETQQNIEPTHACSLFTHNLQIDGNDYELDIIDTSGNARYQQQYLPRYLRSCDAILVVYDATNTNTLNNIQQRIKETKKPANFPFIFIGNKFDTNSTVELNTVKEKVRELGLDETLCFEINTHKKENITTPLIAAARQALANGAGRVVEPIDHTQKAAVATHTSFFARLRKYLTAICAAITSWVLGETGGSEVKSTTPSTNYPPFNNNGFLRLQAGSRSSAPAKKALPLPASISEKIVYQAPVNNNIVVTSNSAQKKL